MNDRTSTRRRRYQFSLQAMLVAIGTGIGVGYATWHVGGDWSKSVSSGDVGSGIYFITAGAGLVAAIVGALVAERARRF